MERHRALDGAPGVPARPSKFLRDGERTLNLKPSSP